MSNFAFVGAADWPEIHTDCARAESYLSADPRTACFYSRRAVEQLVDLLYDVIALPLPYKNDLSARINEPPFRAQVPPAIVQKLNLIRKAGNAAVHEQKQIAPNIALAVLRELHHIMVWAVYHHSAYPKAAPLKLPFDPKLAAKAAPLSRQEVAALAAKFAAQDEAHTKALAEKDELAAARDAEIAQLREEVKKAQAANLQPDDRDYSEAQTRDTFIDLMLNEAGWPLADARDREFEVTGMPPDNGTGFVDYVLWGANGLPLAVVEAKRTSKSPHIGEQQAKLYADCLEKMTGQRPVIFYTNGFEHWIWDDAAGYPPRPIQGFYTHDELELLVQRRQTRQPLPEAPIDSAIVERHYQHRAIRAIDETFTDKRREALLVMATGSGKTRTVIALVKQLMEANWAKRVLFLADRTALVTQAAGAFKTHLPDATTVNLLTEKITDGRVYVSTYPTMMNLINDTGSGIRKFGPGYFDLVVIDEAHRSVYQKYRTIFDWFDSLLVGLTATPKDEVDHNTYRLFHLEDGVPTDAYGLDDAVKEGFLVPAVGITSSTKFLDRGIRYADLPEAEKDEWEALDWGDETPDEVTSEEVNKVLFNESTVDLVLAELMAKGHRVAAGDRLGKTIIFAKNRDHAEFIAQQFNIQYPHLAGHFARVITHSTSHAQSLIDDFSIPDKAPHIAISVDMLDTGIDVPEVVNLVFFKLVRSKTKFWQMIGRGTRLCPDLFGPGQHKQNFYVFDFCGNLEYFSQDLPGSPGSLQKSLNQRLFETRLGLIAALDNLQPPTVPDPPEGQGAESERGLRVDVAWSLHRIVAGMTLDNFLVRPHRRLVEQYAHWEPWAGTLSNEAASDVAESLAGLPSTHKDDDEDAKRFDMLILRRQLAQLEGDALASERLREKIQDIASGLLNQTNIPEIRAQEALLDEVASDEWWVDVTLPMLELARRRLRRLLRLLEKAKKVVVYTDFADELGEATLVDLPGITPGTNWERFELKARAYLKQHQDHVALQRLHRNKPLTAADLEALERMLVDSGTGGADDIALAKEQSHGLGLFIRGLVGLDREAATEAFSAFLDGTRFGTDQIRFINLIITELTATGVVEPARLYESPYIDHAPTGPDHVFADADVDNIVQILNTVKENAVPADGVA
ncbi:type I restriction enzyme R subunit [Mycobacterium frederiksbergense]|uniref:Type I restriction enzyme R subunit n=1 Tax=Mycolicibacterium frederiksbergense TaxID=117567 RepID=A0ABT6KUP2_9MYCO|nr:DEAD/DEAH box helicase family protein [Mycolicibacterium frederiksbergense]MDH6194430.1 type I restriction enzyme R subunit [Mycolicibacterium frederiksbergense]